MIYVDQAITLHFDIQQDITGYSALVVNVLKPDGTEIEWTPSVTLATAGTIYYDEDGSTITIPGEYKMQPVVTISGGDYPGKTAKMFIHRRYD